MDMSFHRSGERPWLLAFAPAGDYFMQPLPWYSTGRLVAPYRLTVSGQASHPDETPPRHTITLGQPFDLAGSGLADGAVRTWSRQSNPRKSATGSVCGFCRRWRTSNCWRQSGACLRPTPGVPLPSSRRDGPLAC